MQCFLGFCAVAVMASAMRMDVKSRLQRQESIYIRSQYEPFRIVRRLEKLLKQHTAIAISADSSSTTYEVESSNGEKVIVRRIGQHTGVEFDECSEAVDQIFFQDRMAKHGEALPIYYLEPRACPAQQGIVVIMGTASGGNLLTDAKDADGFAKPLSESVLYDIAQQLLRALRFLHGSEIVLSDATLENVMVLYPNDLPDDVAILGWKTVCLTHPCRFLLSGFDAAKSTLMMREKDLKESDRAEDFLIMGKLLFEVYAGFFPDLNKLSSGSTGYDLFEQIDEDPAKLNPLSDDLKEVLLTLLEPSSVTRSGHAIEGGELDRVMAKWQRSLSKSSVSELTLKDFLKVPPSFRQSFSSSKPVLTPPLEPIPGVMLNVFVTIPYEISTDASNESTAVDYVKIEWGERDVLNKYKIHSDDESIRQIRRDGKSADLEVTRLDLPVSQNVKFTFCENSGGVLRSVPMMFGKDRSQCNPLHQVDVQLDKMPVVVKYADGLEVATIDLCHGTSCGGTASVGTFFHLLGFKPHESVYKDEA